MIDAPEAGNLGELPSHLCRGIYLPLLEPYLAYYPLPRLRAISTNNHVMAVSLTSNQQSASFLGNLRLNDLF